MQDAEGVPLAAARKPRRPTSHLAVASVLLAVLAFLGPLISLYVLDDVFVFLLSVLIAAVAILAALALGILGLALALIRRRSGVGMPLAACGLSVLVILVAAAQTTGRVDFFLHARSYEAVVEAVKKAGLPPGGEKAFILEHPWDPSSLRELARDELLPRGRERGCVGARRTRDGNYQVSILVQHWGHAGIYGYLYAEGPLPRVHGDPYSTVSAPGRMQQLGAQLAANWWEIYSNLE